MANEIRTVTVKSTGKEIMVYQYKLKLDTWIDYADRLTEYKTSELTFKDVKDNR